MAKSILQVAPNLVVKIQPHESSERVIGFVNSLSFGVSQGQKPQFTVDSSFPETIDQAASPSMVSGSMNLYLPKSTTLEGLGLVPARKNELGEIIMGQAKFFDMKISDRLQNKLIYTLTQCKIGNYTLIASSRSIVIISVTFQAIHLQHA